MADHALIEEAFKPLGSITAKEIVECDDPSSIANLAGHLKKEHLRHLGYKLLTRGDALLPNDHPVVKRHFYFAAAGDFLYRWRNTDSFALELAIDYYRRQISIAPEAARQFMVSPDWGFIPAHAGYRQLRIIEEKRGNFARARALCLKAKAEGWKDDWDKQIATLDKKIAKAGTD